MLGSPYMYDRKAIFYGEDNRYQLTKDGIDYIVRAHRMKTNISLVSANQMKRLIIQVELCSYDSKRNIC